MATGAEVFIKNLTQELDELAVKYNKTKDPGLRDQWFKKVSQVPPVSALEEARLSSRKKTLGKARTFRSD
jgi:hypothetical protein